MPWQSERRRQRAHVHSGSSARVQWNDLADVPRRTHRWSNATQSAGRAIHHLIEVSCFAEKCVVSERSLIKIDSEYRRRSPPSPDARSSPVWARRSTREGRHRDGVPVVGAGGAGRSAIMGLNLTTGTPRVDRSTSASSMSGRCLLSRLSARAGAGARTAKAYDSPKGVLGKPAHTSRSAVTARTVVCRRRDQRRKEIPMSQSTTGERRVVEKRLAPCRDTSIA